jgi:hypothetical protein
MFALAIAAGCGVVPERGQAPVLPPSSLYVEAADQVLVGGVVGEAYTSAVVADGGVPPYTWLAADPLPPGLTLGIDGAITGTPVRAGSQTFALIATDAEGRTKRMLATFTAVLVPERLHCGDHVEGSFSDGIFDGNPDLSRLDDLRWYAIELPHDATTRVDVVVGSTGELAAWLQRSNQLLGSWELRSYAQRTVDPDDSPRHLPVDAGTDPSLTEFQTQSLLPLLLAPKEAGAWTVDIECTDGPVFESLDKYPRRVGESFDQDFDVFGDNTGVRIWTEDPLPSWMTWDESTGTVGGIPDAPGAWELTLRATAKDGRERSETALLAVYETTDIACGSVEPVSVTEGFTDGEQTRRYDPRGYQVFRVPLEGIPEVSGVELRLRGSDTNYLGLSRPKPGWQRFFGAADTEETTGARAVLRVDSTTYPSTRPFVDDTELWFVAASEGVDLEGMELEVACEYEPRPDVPGLPILDEFQPVDLTLGGIGGYPPYRWAATGLPSGLRLSETGQVTGSTSDTGRHVVTFTVTDTVGVAGEQALTWVVGASDACLGYRALTCGQGVDAELVDEGPDGGAAARDTYCIPDTSVDIGFVVEAEDGEFQLALADPGVSRRSQVIDEDHFTWAGEIERRQVIGIPFDTFSFPDRADYVDRPLFVTVWADDPGWYALDVECPVFGPE